MVKRTWNAVAELYVTSCGLQVYYIYCENVRVDLFVEIADRDAARCVCVWRVAFDNGAV